MKYENIALFISLIILNGEIYNIIANQQLNNPTLFMIGGVFSNNKSKKCFEQTLNVSNMKRKIFKFS